MKKGFTLLELLVVIAIIGVLASVVIASLSSARNKGRDSAYFQGLQQFGTLMELEYAATGSYAGLNPGGGWIPGGGQVSVYSCDNAYNSGSANDNIKKANALCKQITTNDTYNFYRFLIYAQADKYSITSWASDEKLYCIGSKGKSWPAIDYNSIGCQSNY